MHEQPPEMLERPQIAQVNEPKAPSKYEVPDVTLLSDYDRSIYFKPGSDGAEKHHQQPTNILGNLFNNPEKDFGRKSVLHRHLGGVKESNDAQRYLNEKENNNPLTNEFLEQRNSNVNEAEKKNVIGSQEYNPASYKAYKIASQETRESLPKKPVNSLLEMLDGMITEQNKSVPTSLQQNLKPKTVRSHVKKIQPTMISPQNVVASDRRSTNYNSNSRVESQDTVTTNNHLCRIIEQQNAQILHLQKVIEKLLDHNITMENSRSITCETCRKQPFLVSSSTQTNTITHQVASTNTDPLAEMEGRFTPLVIKKKSSLACKKPAPRETIEKQVSFTLGDFCMNTIHEDPPSPDPSVHIDESLEYEESCMDLTRFVANKGQNSKCCYPPQMGERAIVPKNGVQTDELSLLRNVKTQIERILEPPKKEVQFHKESQLVRHDGPVHVQMHENQTMGKVNVLQQQLQQLGISFLDPSKLTENRQQVLGTVYQRQVCSQIMSVYEKEGEFSDQQFAAIAEAAKGNIGMMPYNEGNTNSIATTEYLNKYGLQK